MLFYCGIDLHAKESVLCIIDTQDTIHFRKKVSNQINHILEVLDSFTPKPKVALEATLNWYWLVDGLQEAGFEVKLAHPFGLQVIKKAKVKTDNRDAFHLARLLRLEALPESYIYPKETRPLRDLLRKRQKIVSLRAAEYTSLHRTLLQQGIVDIPAVQAKEFKAKEIEQYFEHPVIQYRCAMELERIGFYTRQIKILEEIIFGDATEHQDFLLLQTIPGVGKLLASIILYETGDVNRFPTAKQYCSYSRVVPGIAQSSNTVRRGKGSKQGNPYLKFAFMQAASLAVRFDGPIRRFRLRHMGRRRSKARKLISVSIVAHKLAVAAYQILKDKKVFQMESMFGSYV
jgi:transposase